LPQKLIILDGRGRQIKSIPINEDFKIYNPIIASGDLYFTQVSDSILTYDRNGNLIRTISLEKGSNPIRFLSTSKKNSFWLETQNDLVLFKKERD
jgi:hypothetical protein